jgi:hypothetical protein
MQFLVGVRLVQVLDDTHYLLEKVDRQLILPLHGFVFVDEPENV